MDDGGTFFRKLNCDSTEFLCLIITLKNSPDQYLQATVLATFQQDGGKCTGPRKFRHLLPGVGNYYIAEIRQEFCSCRIFLN